MIIEEVKKIDAERCAFLNFWTRSQALEFAYDEGMKAGIKLTFDKAYEDGKKEGIRLASKKAKVRRANGQN